MKHTCPKCETRYDVNDITLRDVAYSGVKYCPFCGGITDDYAVERMKGSVKEYKINVEGMVVPE